MRTIDISFPIQDRMAGFPGDPPVRVQRTKSITEGSPYNVSSLSLSSHSGTHVDPPIHFVPGGATTDQLSLDAFNGPCRVVEVPSEDPEIGPEAFRTLAPGDVRVLFRTTNSQRWKDPPEFFSDYVALSPAGAAEAVRRKLRLVGIDSLSVEGMGGADYPVHHTLLGAGVLILEGLLLGKVPQGNYELRFLPLLIRGGDGGPGRALLLSP